MRTSTSSGPGAARLTGRISPAPGSRSQNARALASTGTCLLSLTRVNRPRSRLVSVGDTAAIAAKCLAQRYGEVVQGVRATELIGPVFDPDPTIGHDSSDGSGPPEPHRPAAGHRPKVAGRVAAAAVGAVAQLAVLTVLAATVGLGAVGWLVGVGYARDRRCAADRIDARLGHGRARTGRPDHPVPIGAGRRCDRAGRRRAGQTRLGRPSLLGLSAVALALDGVDGWWARRTGTCSAFGARFDMEVDAFLILVLSVYVARDLRRLGAGDRVGPLRPGPRHAAAALAASPGAAPVLAQGGRRGPGHHPRRRGQPACCRAVLSTLALMVALAMLAESFGRDVVWLWRRRTEPLPADRTMAPTSSTVDAGDFATIGRGLAGHPASPAYCSGSALVGTDRSTG